MATTDALDAICVAMIEEFDNKPPANPRDHSKSVH